MRKSTIQRRSMRTVIQLFSSIFICLCCISDTDASWVDPDTPQRDRSTRPLSVGDNREYRLVFSDEFEQDGRLLNDGFDPRWNAINKNDYTNAALHYYSHDNVRTMNGVLNITTEQKVNYYRAFDEKKKFWYIDKKFIQSGMVQTWNKFCFIGGIVEFRAKLPGDPHKGGLWPALWLLGNLARATYVGSSDFVWPYSYNKCNSATRLSQVINACSKVNHYGLAPYTGRGSPEIDVLEAMQGEAGPLPNTFIEKPYQSSSLQVAPGLEIDRPVLGKRPIKGHWYERLEYSTLNHSDLNPFFYGVTLVHHPKFLTYQSDAISANFQLNTTHYKNHHLYRIEWEPPAPDGTGGYIKWFTDGEFSFGINGASLNLTGTEIPSEPMYLIMNTAVSHTWGFPTPCPDNCECDCYECGNPACACALPTGYCENFPAGFEIDYVRVYQAVNDSRHIMGCSPEHRPTAQYIEGHVKSFTAEGDKYLLRSIQSGGGDCQKDSDCGRFEAMGSCSSNGLCVCAPNFTGPHCLAHSGFYDVDTSKHEEPFPFFHMVIPNSMLIVAGILATGFLLSLLRTVRAKIRLPKYQKLGDASLISNNGSARVTKVTEPAITSYQDSAAVLYTLPRHEQKRDVTYCVIDDRLVDNP